MKSFEFDLQRFDETISSGDVTISAGGTYTLASGYTGTITIATTDAVTIDGSSAGSLTDAQIVSTTSADLTINSLTIANPNVSPIKFGAMGNALTLTGDNTLSTGNSYAAAVNIGGGLTISGTGTLSASSTGYGAAVGTDYGENSTTNLIVTGGIVNATANYGAAVGSGFASTIGTVSVTGGTVNATSILGAGLGTGAGTATLDNTGTISLTGGTVTAASRDGAGVGSGFDGKIGDITIDGSAVVKASSTGYGAGVGSGSTFGNESSAGNISITGNANVTASAAQYGAGIGTGYSRYNGVNSAGNISIGGDALVTAASVANGLGLGTGYADNVGLNSVGTITLSGDTSTSARSTVVVDNSDTTRSVTINGSALSGSQLTFVDGVQSNPTTNVTDNSTNITIGENVSGATNVGKVDGSDDYIYVGGIGIISDYAGVTLGGEETTTETTEVTSTVEATGPKIRYATDFSGLAFDGYTLTLNSSTGALFVQNCKDKIIAIADPAGNTTAYAYSPTESGTIYGTALTQLEAIAGSDRGADVILAGNGGATMWGGFGDGNDSMFGGAAHDEFIYLDGTGHDVVSNYGSEDFIKVNGTINGVNLFGNFALNFSNGSLTVADCQDKLITVTDGAGNVGGQAYFASTAGVLNGANLAGVGVIVGGAFGDNLIIAGNGGSKLWGNFGGVDTLVGGAGQDEFVYTPGSGFVFVQNANVFDTVNLAGVSVDQIANIAVTTTDTTIRFTDGGAINVQGVGVTYKLAGGTYIADRYTQTLAVSG